MPAPRPDRSSLEGRPIQYLFEVSLHSGPNRGQLEGLQVPARPGHDQPDQRHGLRDDKFGIEELRAVPVFDERYQPDKHTD